MASNLIEEIEVPTSSAAVETLAKMASSRVLNRRNFMTALGVTSAAGAALIASRASEHPDTVLAAGPGPTDVLNFALNLEYLEATYYSYITQGVDLPASVTVGSGAITNPPAKITFTGPNAAQITDMLNEIYYDELNHVLTLQALLGTTAIARPAINLAPTAVVINANTAIGLARLFEDIGVTAYAGAASILSGANLTYAAQILAVEGFHSGALRLVSLQNPGTIFYTTTGASTAVGSVTAGSNILANVYFNQTTAAIGQIVTGPGLSGGAAITAIKGYPILGSLTLGSNTVTGVTNVAGQSTVPGTNTTAINGLAIGQTVTGVGIPNGTTITQIATAAPYTITLSSPATATTTAGTITVVINAPFTATTAKTTALTAVSPSPALLGMAVGQQITGSGIAANSFITAISGTTVTLSVATTASATGVALVAGVGALTLNANATGTFADDVYFIGSDANDVPTYDEGTAALAAAGPTSKGGFFATSGGGNATAQVPAGVAFARTTSQVLAILYGTGSIFAAAGTAKGGFFPNGVNGIINTV